MSEIKRWQRFETKNLQQIFDLVSIVNPDRQETGKKIDPESGEDIYLINWYIDDPDQEKESLTKWNKYLNAKEDEQK